MLDAFLEENPDATEEDLYLALGSPKELAEQMMEECASNTTRSFLKEHTNKIIVVSVVLCLALGFVSVFAYQAWYSAVHTEVNQTVYIYSTSGPISFQTFPYE